MNLDAYMPRPACNLLLFKNKKIPRKTRLLIIHYTSLRIVLVPQLFLYISLIYYTTIMYEVHLLFDTFTHKLDIFFKLKIYSLYQLIELRMERRKLQEIKLIANDALSTLPLIWFTQALFESCLCLIRSILIENVIYTFQNVSQRWSVFTFSLIFLSLTTYFVNYITLFEMDISNKIGDNIAKENNSRIDIKIEEIKFNQEIISHPFVPLTIGESFNLNLTFLLSFITMIIPLAIISANLIKL